MTIPAARSVEDIAMLLGVCDKTVRNLIKSGALKAHRIGRRIRIFDEDFDRYKSQARIKPNG